MKLFKNTEIIFPPLIVLIEGSLAYIIFAIGLLFFTLSYFGVYPPWLNVEPHSIVVNILGAALFLFLDVIFIYLFHKTGWMAFGYLLFTRDSVIFFGLFMPIIKLRYDEIEYAEIREYIEGNPYYDDYGGIDFYKFALLSPNPLPQERKCTLLPSSRKQLIKVRISYRLCQLLQERLGEHQKKPFEYQLHLYHQAGIKPKKKNKNKK